MIMKKDNLLRVLLLAFLLVPMAGMMGVGRSHVQAQSQVTMQTTMGKIVIELYDDTPIHRDNFLAQVRRGYYDGILFHRIIQSFMIQAGDSVSRSVSSCEYSPSDDDLSPESMLPAEILYPKRFHRRGVLAAARIGDEVNPERRSSPYEFYIAWGKYFTPRDMDAQQEKVLEREDSTRHFLYPPEVRDAYEMDGGIPHLDNEYTVFGEVVKGLDVVGQIQAVKTDSLDRPLKDVRIKKAWISR